MLTCSRKRSDNILNTYSTALSIQALGRPFAMVPRFLWVFIVFVIYTVAGVAGREHLSTLLTNFLSILSYWLAFFIVIVAEEHFLFRRKGGRLGGYNLADWDNPSKYVSLVLRGCRNDSVSYSYALGSPFLICRLPIGIAGMLASCFGIAGAVVGMSQVWYTGPIGKMAGATYGTDLGFEVHTAPFLDITVLNQSVSLMHFFFFPSCIARSLFFSSDISTFAMDGDSLDGEVSKMEFCRRIFGAGKRKSACISFVFTLGTKFSLSIES